MRSTGVARLRGDPGPTLTQYLLSISKGKAMPDVYNRFILIDANGDECMHYHQDDMEDPIVADTIKTLLCRAADWADLGVKDFIRLHLFPAGEPAKFFIFHERVVRRPLDDRENIDLAGLRTQYGA